MPMRHITVPANLRTGPAYRQLQTSGAAPLNDVHCPNGHLVGKVDGNAEIKCRACGQLAVRRAVSPSPGTPAARSLDIAKHPVLGKVANAAHELANLPVGAVTKKTKVSRNAKSQIDEATTIERGALGIASEAAAALNGFWPKSQLEYDAALALSVEVAKAARPHFPTWANETELTARRKLDARRVTLE
jgi:hypothetical protein